MMRTAAALALIFLISGVSGASAHHSLSFYETYYYIRAEGIVSSFTWKNPHTDLVLTVTEPSGETDDIYFEGGSTARLNRGGFSADTLSAGDAITVFYNPKKNGMEGGFFLGIEKADGTLYALPRFHQLEERPSGAE